MLNCFVLDKSIKDLIPITFVSIEKFSDWQKNQPEFIQHWLMHTKFMPQAGNVRLIPDASGRIKQVICCVEKMDSLWNAGQLPLFLPEGLYTFDVTGLSENILQQYAIAWGLGAYQFTRYKKADRAPAQLFLHADQKTEVENIVQAIYQVRDWINTPTDDMGPTQLAECAEKLAKEFAAEFSQIVGEKLLKYNYASIYTVGRASDDAPRLLDMRWGNPKHPKLTLVGKGVCFDSGGLDIKSSPHMLLMKKDMAGGAHVFGLARMIMTAKLPVRLRVLVPAVENVISGNAYRPGDIIKSRKGITIEVGNTDAEGRVILADALAEAVSEKPDLLIDITTLTGAARVALGTELPALFSNNDQLAMDLIKAGEKYVDPMWRMPLFDLYREYLNSQIADINNNSSEPYGGAITAALFLKEFVPSDIPWAHFDMMAWNLKPRPGRPIGGEAMALRALFAYVKEKYS